MFVYERSGCGFDSRCNHLNFPYLTCFEQGISWHPGNYKISIHCKRLCNMIKAQSQYHTVARNWRKSDGFCESANIFLIDFDRKSSDVSIDFEISQPFNPWYSVKGHRRNLHLKTAGLFEYARPFSEHQTLEV